MSTIIRDENLTKIPGNVKPDSRRRIVLPAAALSGEDIVYQIYTNSSGQIVLDPQVTIPASEAWIFKDKDSLRLVDRGMAESEGGQVSDIGSFSKYLEK